MGGEESKPQVICNKLIDISDINKIAQFKSQTQESSKIIPILVIGEPGSGKSSFINYLMTQCGIHKSNQCKISNQLQGTQNIWCYQFQNLLLIDTQGFVYDSSRDNQQKSYFEFLNQLTSVSQIVFFIQEGIRDRIPSKQFLKNLQNQNLLQDKMVQLVKNNLNENDITQQHFGQNEQYKILLSLNNLKGNIVSVKQKVGNSIQEFNLQNIIQTKKDQLSIPISQFNQNLSNIINSWNQLKIQQPAQDFHLQRHVNQSKKKQSKILCMFQQDQNKKYKLNYDKELFEEVLTDKVNSDKIKTIICCGKTGVGKSFFLTQLCKQFGQDDIIFDYHNSTQQKTIGIQYHRFKDKDNYDVFLMDCQGFDYYDEDLDANQQMELQKQLKFLISMFSKSFQYFIFMQTGIRNSEELNKIEQLMAESALNFIQPQIFVIKNKLNSQQVREFKQTHRQLNDGKQYLPLINLNQDSQSVFDGQIEKIFKILQNEKPSKNSFFNFYEVVEYIQLSISIFNGEIDNQLQNIQQILQLRFKYTQVIRERNQRFLENMKKNLQRQKENYSKQSDVFFFCSQNILVSAFYDQQLELVKNDYIEFDRQWDSQLKELNSKLIFENEDSKNQILQKYAQLDKVAPELIQHIKLYQKNNDYNELKLILTSIFYGGTMTASLVCTFVASASAATIAVAETSTAVAATAGGLVTSAITCGISAGVLLIAGLYFGGKQIKKYKKNKIQKQKSLQLLQSLRIQRMVFINGQQGNINNLYQAIVDSFGPNSDQQLRTFIQNKQNDQQFFGLLLIAFMLIDNSSQDFEKMTKILQDKKNEKFINVYKKADQLLSQLGQNNVENIWEIQFDMLYSQDYSDIKSKNFTIDENDVGNVFIQSLKCNNNFEQITNYNQHQSLYNCLALLRAQSKLFIINFMFKHFIENNTRYFQSFIFQEFNGMLQRVGTILKE